MKREQFQNEFNSLILGIKDRPVIQMIGEKSKDVVIVTPKQPILSLCHIYDCSGSELVQDKDSDVKYTVLLNRRNVLPAQPQEEGEEQEVKVTFSQIIFYTVRFLLYP